MTKTEERAKSYAMYKSDIGYDFSVCKSSFTDGAEWMLERVCAWIKEHIDIPYDGRIIDGQPHAMDYIEWCEKRIEYANAAADAIKRAMEE